AGGVGRAHGEVADLEGGRVDEQLLDRADIGAVGRAHRPPARVRLPVGDAVVGQAREGSERGRAFDAHGRLELGRTVDRAGVRRARPAPQIGVRACVCSRQPVLVFAGELAEAVLPCGDLLEAPAGEPGDPHFTPPGLGPRMADRDEHVLAERPQADIQVARAPLAVDEQVVDGARARPIVAGPDGPPAYVYL